jgi:tetratricopeptide (TPR) repeat protein
VAQQKLIEDLRDRLAKGDVLVVAGTGVSIQASGNSPCASWSGLIADGIEHCVGTNLMSEAEALPLREQLRSTTPATLIKVAETVSKTLGAPDGGEFLRWLQMSVGKLPSKDGAIIDAIHELQSPVATTNYDDLLTRGRGIDALPWTSALAPEIIRGDREAVLHLHGYYLYPESVILGVSSYEKILSDYSAQGLQQAVIARSTLLFVGSGDGLQDPNFGPLLDWSAKAFGKSIYRHYCLCRSSERAALQKRFPLDSRLFYIEYGSDHSDLAPFLRRELVPFAKLRKPVFATLPNPGYCIGRDAEVEEVVAALLADKPKPLPILGGPGMGKTTIALTALRDARVAGRFGPRRSFIRCDGVKTRQDLAAAIAQALGIRLSSNVEPEVVTALAARPSALLIDNAETPLDAGKEDVVELLASLASIETLALIVTIRGHKRPPRIPWLSTMEAERLNTTDAGDVFVKVSGRPQFATDPHLAQLLGALDGMALAITLMARYSEAYEKLEPVWLRWQALHTAMLKEGSGRLENLNVSYALSIEVLSSEARRLLSMLAMLPGGVAAIDLPLVFPDPEEAAHELRGRALVFEEGKRLRMLAPLREYVSAEHPPGDDDPRRVVDHYLGLAMIEGAKVGAEGGSGAVSRLAPEVGNVEAMFVSSGLAGFGPIGPVVYGWAEFMRFTGVGSTGVVETVAARARESGDSKDAARCIESLGDIARSRSDHERARGRFEEALQLYQKVGDLPGEANCIWSLGDIAWSRSDHEGARSRYEEALPLYRKVGSVLGEANCIQSLGNIALRRSDDDGARARYEEALPLYRKVGDVLGEANCIKSLGDIALRRSDDEGARERYEEALALNRKVGSVVGEANCIQSLGHIALARSDYEGARSRYEEALPLYRKVGDVLGEANCIRGLGDIALNRSDHDGARARYEEALPLYRKVGDVLGEANCILRLGDIALSRSDDEGARARYEEALPLYQRIREPYSMGWTHRRLASLSVDQTRKAHVAAAREAWRSIKRDDLIADLDEEFGSDEH